MSASVVAPSPRARSAGRCASGPSRAPAAKPPNGASRRRWLWAVALVVVAAAASFGLWSIRIGRLVVLGGTPTERSALGGLLGPAVVGAHPFLLGVGSLRARLHEDATLATEVRLVSLTRVGLGEEVLTVVPRQPAAMLANGLVVYRNGLVLSGGGGGQVVVCPAATPLPVATCASELAPGARLSSSVVATVAALAQEGVAAVVSETTGGGVAVRLGNGAGCLLGRAEHAGAEIATCRAFAGPGELVDVTNPNAPAGLGQWRVG
jgi:hypothetical protein